MINILKPVSVIVFCFGLAIKPAKSAEIVFCQEVSVEDTSNSKRVHKYAPNPRTATILAAIPGWGQVYNRDFWKVPIVYASLGGSIFTFHLNALKYQDFLSAYLSFYDLNTGEPAHGITGNSRLPVVVRNLFNTGKKVELLTRDQIVRRKDAWRRYKNISIFTTGLVYVLSIIEANVAAHLKTFDVSDDISFQIYPSLKSLNSANGNAGVQVVFSFK